MRLFWVSILLATAAFVCSAMVIDPGYANSGLLPGPGVTLDEPINLNQSLFLADAIGQHGPLLFSPTVAREVFGSDDYMSDYPPLGRTISGLSHQFFSGWFPGVEQSPVCLPAARMGSCLAFGFCVFIVFRCVLRGDGFATAMTAAVGLILFPQFIGHARLANVDMTTAVTWFLASAAICRWWLDESAPRTHHSLISGVAWGMLMLTKMQGLLFPPVLVIWAFWRFRSGAIRPLISFGIAGGMTFFCLWPWLWLDPIAHVKAYLGTASERQTIYVWYLGERFADRDVPWHYSFIMLFAATPLYVVPGLLKQCIVRDWNRMDGWLLMSSVWPLVVFALPGVPVYDGIRLYLCVVPGMVILSARGLCRKSRSTLLDRGAWTISAAGIILTLSFADPFSPFAVNQYSELIGRGSGAASLGMESDFWADAMNGPFWEQVPEDSTIYVAPVLHRIQLSGAELMTPMISQRRIRLVPFEYDPRQQKGLLLSIHRLADLRMSLRDIPDGGRMIAEVRHDGVVLARLIDTTYATWQETP
ncbi:MAG: glycosyltransferase family 39 protein [Planctomyces sp.]|nr:glycosyltransferase family 39 protein [Planctomyces sp.]